MFLDSRNRDLTVRVSRCKRLAGATEANLKFGSSLPDSGEV